MKARIAFLTFITGLCFANFAQAESLRHFETDYCTSFPEGTREHRELWRSCCIRHDLFLWAGGTEEQRLETDRGLKECVISKGAKVPAWIMYLGVRIGSRSPIRYKAKEWGNAWTLSQPNRNRYQALTPDEVRELLSDLWLHPNPEISPQLYWEFQTNLQVRNLGRPDRGRDDLRF